MGWGGYCDNGAARSNPLAHQAGATNRETGRRVKEVFNKDQCIHVWAQRTQTSGRASFGNVYFVGDVLYSYGSHYIAAQFVTHADAVAVILNATKYSVTTTQHVGAARSASLHYPQFTLPDADADPEKARAYYGREIADAFAKAKRARKNGARHLDRADRLITEALDFSEFFALGWTAELMHHQAQISAEALEEARAEARRKAAAERERLRGEFEKWRNGESDWCPHQFARDENGSVYCRVKGDEIQTSMNARVPLAHAVRVYKFAKLCRERGEGWRANGRTLRVGHFRVDYITASGDMKAGCHRFTWARIEEAARMAGVADLEAADTTESKEGAA